MNTGFTVAEDKLQWWISVNKPDGRELLGSIQGEKVLDWLRYYWLLKKE